MLYYGNATWNICIEKVKYIQANEELENHVGQEGKQWWIDLADRKVIEIIEFTEIIATQEQLSRLEEINQLNIGDGYSTILADYVIHNKFPSEVNHILKDLENRVNQQMQEPYIMELDFRISMIELGF